MPGSAHRCRGIDKHCKPLGSSFKPHVKREVKRSMREADIVLMPGLGAVKSHEFVDHSQLPGLISGFGGPLKRLSHVRFGFGSAFMPGIYSVKPREETLRIEIGKIPAFYVSAGASVPVSGGTGSRLRRLRGSHVSGMTFAAAVLVFVFVSTGVAHTCHGIA